MTSKLTLCLVSASAFLMMGCSSVTPLYHKDGTEAYSTVCSGGSWIKCYERAGDKCKTAGYEIIEKLSGREYGFWSAVETKEVVFSCKASTESATK